MARLIAAVILDTPLDGPALARACADDRCGSVASFEGVVRNHDEGKGVTGIEYSAHPDAAAFLRETIEPFLDRDGVHAIGVRHRVGTLAIGDIAIVATVASEHRAEGFAVLAELITAVKASVPIWKHQAFTDGTTEWSALP